MWDCAVARHTSWLTLQSFAVATCFTAGKKRVSIQLITFCSPRGTRNTCSHFGCQQSWYVHVPMYTFNSSLYLLPPCLLLVFKNYRRVLQTSSCSWLRLSFLHCQGSSSAWDQSQHILGWPHRPTRRIMSAWRHHRPGDWGQSTISCVWAVGHTSRGKPLVG